MRKINSPLTFKTCEIAAIKEQLGLLNPKLKKVSSRKVKVNPYHAVFIKKAIEEFISDNIFPTYKQIQEKAFELYKKQRLNKIKKYQGIFKSKFSRQAAQEIIEDEEIIYG